jgi:LAGLIDADG DNA endonuclease family protein
VGVLAHVRLLGRASKAAGSRPIHWLDLAVLCHQRVTPSFRETALRTEEVGWAAGFFEADGCCSFSQAGGYARLSIGQTFREPLDRFARIVNAGKIRGPFSAQSTNRPSKRPQYQYYLYRSEDLWRVAKLLWPLLGMEKRAQIRRVSRRAVRGSGSALFATRFSLRPCRDSRRVSLAWAAGFFDGEGCFSYSSAARYPCVSITQKDREVLDRFRAVVRIGKVYGPYRNPPGRTLSTNPFYLYRTHGYERVQAVAALLWFELGSAKHAQATAVLKTWPRTCRRGHELVPGHSGCGRCTADYWHCFRQARRQASLRG